MINMDSYLCKAKKITTGEWIEGYPYWISERVNPNIMIRNSCGESHEVDSSSLCKFTGKEYMDGEKAYEGDIFESQSDGTSMILKYGTYQAYCPADKCVMDSVGFYAEAEGYPQMPIGDLNEYALKLGNIIDNPELLE